MNPRKAAREEIRPDLRALWRLGRALMPVVLGLVAFEIAQDRAPPVQSREFYVTSAQVVVVLLIGLGIEGRALTVKRFRGPPEGTSDRWWVLATAILVVTQFTIAFSLVAAELESIQGSGATHAVVLMSRHADYIFGAVAGGLIGLVVLAAVGSE